MLDALLQTFGRSHLVVLHLPIGLLLVAAMIEAFRVVRPRPIPAAGEDDENLRRLLRQTPTPSAYTCVFFATLFGAYTAVSGWVYTGNEFTTTLWGGGDLEWHRWLGTIAAALSALTLILGLAATLARKTVTTRVYKASLLLAAIAVGWAGHLGGELVHGEGYIIEPVINQLKPKSPTAPPAPAPTPENTPSDADPEAQPAQLQPADAQPGSEAPALVPVAFTFERDIAPILNESCVRCHREGRVRGDLKLDTFADTMSMVVPGDALASELIVRVQLPESDEYSMPKDKPGLPAEQIETLVAWVNALETVPDEPLPPAPEVRHTAGPKTQTPPSTLAIEAADQPIELSPAQREARDAAIDRLRTRMISAGTRAAELGNVEVRVFEARAGFGDADLDLLDGLQPCLTMLDLSGTAITDAGVDRLAREFPRLRVLRLGQTSIGDDAARSLASLSELAMLDVHITGVTADGLSAVAGVGSLRVLRCWNTETTADEIAGLALRFPSVDIQAGE